MNDPARWDASERVRGRPDGAGRLHGPALIQPIRRESLRLPDPHDDPATQEAMSVLRCVAPPAPSTVAGHRPVAKALREDAERYLTTLPETEVAWTRRSAS